jgi:hypothetical protein
MSYTDSKHRTKPSTLLRKARSYTGINRELWMLEVKG